MRTRFVNLLALAVFCLGPALAQAPPEPLPPASGNQPAQPLSPQQLDDLVAPIALYPDPLVGEILAAATYPMEIAEAEQWLQDHRNWKPAKLMDKAKKESWDPSVQGLVAFPDVLAHLTQDMNWTTQLGNAFLAQQSDVMQSVQRMRAQAEARGKLHSTPQETVTTTNQEGQSAIAIEPTDPDLWYVPNYNPVYVWGPPVYGYYPPLLYPGVDFGIGWFPGFDIGLYFGGWGGWGWGGWGWTPNWWGGGLYVNGSFFHRYGFRYPYGGSLVGNSRWVHNPEHRLGVPYANREVANRFARAGGGPAGNFNHSAFSQGAFGGHGFHSPEFEQRSWTGNHSVFGGYHSGQTARVQSDRGFSSMGAGRTFGGGGFHGGGGGFHGGGGGGGFHGGGGGGRR